MIKSDNTYVRISVFLIQFIYIRWRRQSNQHSMSDHSCYINISIDKYYHEILQKFMLAKWLFINPLIDSIPSESNNEPTI